MRSSKLQLFFIYIYIFQTALLWDENENSKALQPSMNYTLGKQITTDLIGLSLKVKVVNGKVFTYVMYDQQKDMRV